MEAKKVKSILMNRSGLTEQIMFGQNDFEGYKQHTAVTKDFTLRATQNLK